MIDIEIGSTLAGVELLELVQNARGISNRIYRVRYTCCGAESTLTGRRLMTRIRNDNEICGACANKRAAQNRTATRKNITYQANTNECVDHYWGGSFLRPHVPWPAPGRTSGPQP